MGSKCRVDKKKDPFSENGEEPEQKEDTFYLYGYSLTDRVFVRILKKISKQHSLFKLSSENESQ